MFAYDQVPYCGAVEAEAHPRYLEALARLRGLQAASLEKCRILELGCASGRMLLQIAEDFPEAQCVGIDLAGERIAEAKSVAEEVGLKNVEFHHGSLEVIDDTWGDFDYILCCGLLSWVLPAIQDEIFRVIKSRLAPSGVAVVTYKTYPGWHYLNVVRDAMRAQTASIDDPVEKIQAARQVVEFLARETDERSLSGEVFRSDGTYLKSASDDYLFHDYLTEHSYPYSFSDFVALVNDAELQYLDETSLVRNNLPMGASTARSELSTLPFVQRCEMLDVLNNTAYRKSILCHGDVVLNDSIDESLLRSMYVSLRSLPAPATFDVTTTVPVTFRYEGGSLTVAAPFGKAALRFLIDAHPRAVSVAEMYDGANNLLPNAASQTDNDVEQGEAMLAAAMLGSLEAGLVQVCLRPPDFVQTVSETPIASPLARALAARSSIVANCCHQNVQLSDDAQLVLSKLNGQRSRGDLATSLSHDADAHNRVEAALEELRHRAFLTA